VGLAVIDPELNRVAGFAQRLHIAVVLKVEGVKVADNYELGRKPGFDAEFGREQLVPFRRLARYPFSRMMECSRVSLKHPVKIIADASKLKTR